MCQVRGEIPCWSEHHFLCNFWLPAQNQPCQPKLATFKTWHEPWNPDWWKGSGTLKISWLMKYALFFYPGRISSPKFHKNAALHQQLQLVTGSTSHPKKIGPEPFIGIQGHPRHPQEIAGLIKVSLTIIVPKNNPLIRPAISWGGGGPLRFPWYLPGIHTKHKREVTASVPARP